MWSNADRDYRFLYKLKTIFFSSNYGTQLCMKVSLWRVFSHSCKGIACATRPMLEEARKLSLGIIFSQTASNKQNKQKSPITHTHTHTHTQFPSVFDVVFAVFLAHKWFKRMLFIRIRQNLQILGVIFLVLEC